MKQTFEIKLTVEVDVEKHGHPREWVKDYVQGDKIATFYGVDITPIDKEDPLHKWVKDFK
jgi:hypothetical protein|tara:strand:- start:5330 stop:5509 length:180 start_codon:yes stop_codon:yes gene_type:complete